MTTPAQDLSDYYSALARIVDDQVKLERLQKALLGTPLDNQELAQLHDIHEELEKRAGAAESLGKLAAAYTELTGLKTPADVSEAAASLGSKLSAIEQLPGASTAPPLLPNAGKALAQLALQHDERKLAAAMDPTMAALAQTFTQEKPAYDSINRTHIGLAQSLALELIKRHQADPGDLLAPALQPFGLASRMPEDHIPQELEEYAREQIHSQGDEEIASHEKASAAMEAALKELSEHMHEFATQGHLAGKLPPLKLTVVELWTKQIL